MLIRVVVPFKGSTNFDPISKLKFIFIYLFLTKKAVIDMRRVYVTPYISGRIGLPSGPFHFLEKILKAENAVAYKGSCCLNGSCLYRWRTVRIFAAYTII